MKKFVFTLLLVFVCHQATPKASTVFSMNSAAKKCRLCQSIFFHDVSWKNVRRTLMKTLRYQKNKVNT